MKQKRLSSDLNVATEGADKKVNTATLNGHVGPAIVVGVNKFTGEGETEMPTKRLNSELERRQDYAL